LLIVSFSLPEKGNKESGNKEMVIKTQGNKEMSVYDNANMPKTIDETFFKESLLEVRKSPNLVHALFIAWEARFKSNQEIKILRKLGDWFKQIEKISDAEAAALLARMRALEARIDIETVETPKYVGVRKETKILNQKAENEELRARIAEAKRRQEGPKEKPPEKEPVKREKPSEDDVRKMMVGRYHTAINDEIAIDGAVGEELRKDSERKLKEIKEVENDPNLPPTEKQRQIHEIETRHFNLRKKILETPGGRTK